MRACECEEGVKGGALHPNITRVKTPFLDTNNNRRRNVFCGEEEVRDGRLERVEEEKKKVEEEN